jgi:hypothetical protein
MEAFEQEPSIWSIWSPDPTRVGVLEDGFESLIHDRNELDAKAGTFFLVPSLPTEARLPRQATRSVRFIARVG